METYEADHPPQPSTPLQRASSYTTSPSRHKVHTVSEPAPCHVGFLGAMNARVDFCCGQITADGVDKCSRICFPLCFLFFNVLYWSIYTQRVVFNNSFA